MTRYWLAQLEADFAPQKPDDGRAHCGGCLHAPSPFCAACGAPTAHVERATDEEAGTEHAITFCVDCWEIVLESRAEVGQQQTHKGPTGQQVMTPRRKRAYERQKAKTDERLAALYQPGMTQTTLRRLARVSSDAARRYIERIQPTTPVVSSPLPATTEKPVAAPTSGKTKSGNGLQTPNTHVENLSSDEASSRGRDVAVSRASKGSIADTGSASPAATRQTKKRPRQVQAARASRKAVA